MITAIVLFPMPPGTMREDAAAIFRSTAPRYRGVPGLVRKYYVFEAGEAPRAGGVYLWETRADAERAYGEEWRRLVTAKYGAAPEIRWFDTPVVVENGAEGGGGVREYAAGA